MWYSVVTTGKCLVTRSLREIDELKKLYLYPKIRKHNSAEEADNYIRTNGYKEAIKLIRNYGNTIKGFTVHAKYKITKSSLFIFYDTRDIGELMIKENLGLNAIVERSGYVTRVKIENCNLNNSSIKDHIRAIHTLIGILGSMFCINIHIQYFSVYYALTVFPRNSAGSTLPSSMLINEDLMGIAWSYGDYKEE